MVTRTRYECRDCGYGSLLPEHPRYGPPTIRKGCPDCEKIQTFEAASQVQRRQLP